MAGLISFGDHPDQMWSLKNTLYSRFINLAIERCGEDKAVAFELEKSEWVNGISLDTLLAHDVDLARRCADCLLASAKDIAEGRQELLEVQDVQPDVPMESRAQYFRKLVDMIESWKRGQDL